MGAAFLIIFKYTNLFTQLDDILTTDRSEEGYKYSSKNIKGLQIYNIDKVFFDQLIKKYRAENTKFSKMLISNNEQDIPKNIVPLSYIFELTNDEQTGQAMYKVQGENPIIYGGISTNYLEKHGVVIKIYLNPDLVTRVEDEESLSLRVSYFATIGILNLINSDGTNSFSNNYNIAIESLKNYPKASPIQIQKQ